MLDVESAKHALHRAFTMWCRHHERPAGAHFPPVPLTILAEITRNPPNVNGMGRARPAPLALVFHVKQVKFLIPNSNRDGEQWIFPEVLRRNPQLASALSSQPVDPVTERNGREFVDYRLFHPVSRK